jgi:hypothetical protein
MEIVSPRKIVYIKCHTKIQRISPAWDADKDTMKKLLLSALFAALLSGCVTNPAVKYFDDAKMYIAENRPKALGGTMSWTAYYAGGLAIAESIPPNVQGRIDAISMWRESISMAREYETGRITKEEFYKWREEGNARAEAEKASYKKNQAQCEYEARTGAAAVQATGRSGLNFDQMYKERELFELCMKAKQ